MAVGRVVLAWLALVASIVLVMALPIPALRQGRIFQLPVGVALLWTAQPLIAIVAWLLWHRTYGGRRVIEGEGEAP